MTAVRAVGLTGMFAFTVNGLIAGLVHKRLRFPVRHIDVTFTPEQPIYFAITALLWLFMISLLGFFAWTFAHNFVREMRQ
jgi:hypothetical protein